MRHVLGVFSAVALASGAFQIPRLPTLRPVDEAQQEPALVSVRARVLAAARTRDARTIRDVVSLRLKLGDSGDVDDRSQRKFAEMLSNPDEEAWTGLQGALSLGGAFTTTRGAVEGRREFCAPYVYAAFPSTIVTERTPWVIIDNNVAVRAGPSSKSRVLGTLSYAIVSSPGIQRHDPSNYAVIWETIDLSDEREAFVLASKIRNPEGYHVCFANEGGWVIISAFTSHSRIHTSPQNVYKKP